MLVNIDGIEVGVVQHETYCFLLESLNHDSDAAILCFNRVMEHERFKSHNFNSMSFWLDNGNYNRFRLMSLC